MCSSLGARCLRGALLVLGIEHVRYPRGMPYCTSERRLSMLNVPFCRVGCLLFQISAMLCRQSSTETPFVRTHVAVYFISLLICNFVQGVGALLNIPWILKQRVYIGPLCTAQAAVKQFGNVWAF